MLNNINSKLFLDIRVTIKGYNHTQNQKFKQIMFHSMVSSILKKQAITTKVKFFP